AGGVGGAPLDDRLAPEVLDLRAARSLRLGDERHEEEPPSDEVGDACRRGRQKRVRAARCGLEAVAGAHSGEKPVRLALGEPSVEIPGELCVAGIDPVCLPVAREDGRDATAGNIAGAAKLVQLGRVRYDPVDVAGAKGARQVAV